MIEESPNVLDMKKIATRINRKQFTAIILDFNKNV
jgi:hypothetical protein